MYPHPSLSSEHRPDALFSRVQAGGGAFITVTGPSGVGKTMWLKQFLEAVRRFQAVSVSADRFEQGFPFAVLDKIVRAAGMRAGVLDAGISVEMSTAIRALLSALNRGVSRTRRLLLTVDNAQWIDTQSEQALRFVLSRVGYSGACVIFSGQAPRTNEVSNGIARAEPGAWSDEYQITLDPMNSAGVRSYVSQVHQREISLRFADRLRERSAGLPLYVDAVIAELETRSELTRTHWDDGLLLPTRNVNTLWREQATDTPGVVPAVEIVSLLGDAIAIDDVRAIAKKLGDEIDIEAAIAAGLLIGSSSGDVQPFHDLFADEVRTQVTSARRATVLNAAADVVASEHRAFLCRLDAAETLDENLLERTREAATNARLVGDSERAVSYYRRAIGLAEPEKRKALIVETCILAGAMFISPAVLDLLPELEEMPPEPLRDLALLQTRQITGDVVWARSFAEQIFTSEIDHPDAKLIRMHIGMMVIMVQLTLDNYDPIPQQIELVRSAAYQLQAQNLVIHDSKLLPLPSAEQVLLRATAIAVLAAARTGDAGQLEIEIGALSSLIATARDTPALSDALVCRGGFLAGIGRIPAATQDLERMLLLTSDGVIGWSLGHGRVILSYCWWLQGRGTDAAALLEDAVVDALDSVDASSRPLIYLLRAVFAAESGNDSAYAENLRIAREVTVTDYDTFGVELELLAAITFARAHEKPEDVLLALSDDALDGRWLAGASIFTYKVEALSALGRAEEADRELAMLRGRAGRDWAPIYGSLDWLEGLVAEAFLLPERAIRAYRRAAREDSPESTPVLRAQALYDAGRLLLQSGDSSSGTRLLRDAAKVFGSVGAQARLRRSLALIDGTAPGLLSGVERLTSREREIAQLAAAGSTNREISASLYISVPTVAFHMRNILAKLGLTSRRELHLALSAT